MGRCQVYFRIANPTRVAIAPKITHVGCDGEKRRNAIFPILEMQYQIIE